MQATVVRAITFAVFISLALPGIVFSDEDASQKVVVSAHRYATPQDKVASSVTVITAEDIDRSQKTRFSELIREVPGVDIVRSGGAGGNTSVFIRGANSSHTLVVIDGIEMNNPGAPSREFNLAHLSLENIERIEILRGPQGTLYGSDAIGGVISITTKRGKGPVSGELSVEAGSFDTFTEKASLSGGNGRAHFSLGFLREDSGGISAADERDGNGEEDEFQNTGFSFRGGFSPAEEFEMNTVFRFSDSKTDLDNSGGVGGDDPNREFVNQEVFFRTEAKATLFKGVLEQIYGVSLTRHRFRDDNDPDELHPMDLQRSRFKGKLVKWDIQNILTPTEGVRLLLGLETEKETASNFFRSDGAFGPFESFFGPEDSRTNGYYLDALIDPTEWFSTSMGVRVDDHSSFGSEVTFRIAPTVMILGPDTRVTGSVGTGYKAPSLSQLFSSFGNPELDPEESLGWEVGIEQPLFDNDILIGVTYFRNDIDELISFDPQTFIFENIEEAEIDGFELFLRATVLEDLTVGVDYTHLDAEDKATGLELLRRADQQVAVRADYRFLGQKAHAGIRVRHVGDRFDNNFNVFPSERVKLGSYTVVDLLASYRVSEDIELFARVENLFDKEYQDVFGFGTSGVAGYGGIRIG